MLWSVQNLAIIGQLTEWKLECKMEKNRRKWFG